MNGYLFDTTALLAHYLDEPGADEVQRILTEADGPLLIAAPSVAEFARRLWILGEGPAEAREAALRYTMLLDSVVAVDAAVATRAFELAAVAGKRIPLIDALIAAAAQVSEVTLVHRDRHFRGIVTVAQVEI